MLKIIPLIMVYLDIMVWDKSPVNIRSSKSLLDLRKQLKTYLFKHAYDMFFT